MLDINFIRVNPDIVKKDLKKRNEPEKLTWVDDLLRQDKESLGLKQQIEELRHRRNKISEEINEKQKKKQNFSSLVKEAKDLPGKIQSLEGKKEGEGTKESGVGKKEETKINIMLTKVISWFKRLFGNE